MLFLSNRVLKTKKLRLNFDRKSTRLLGTLVLSREPCLRSPRNHAHSIRRVCLPMVCVYFYVDPTTISRVIGKKVSNPVLFLSKLRLSMSKGARGRRFAVFSSGLLTFLLVTREIRVGSMREYAHSIQSGRFYLA